MFLFEYLLKDKMPFRNEILFRKHFIQLTSAEPESFLRIGNSKDQTQSIASGKVLLHDKPQISRLCGICLIRRQKHSPKRANIFLIKPALYPAVYLTAAAKGQMHKYPYHENKNDYFSAI